MPVARVRRLCRSFKENRTQPAEDTQNVTMQIKLFNVPVFGGDGAMDEMNLFLRTTKVLQVENHLISDTSGTFWSFCVKYLETSAPEKKVRVDYKHKTGQWDEAACQRRAQALISFTRHADSVRFRKNVLKRLEGRTAW